MEKRDAVLDRLAARRLPLVLSLVFCSGCCALVYQVTWFRELRLIFGASTPATAAVVAIFMGGLGAGSAWLGKRADAKQRPLAFYGKLELGIGLFAIVTPLLITLARSLYLSLGGTTQLGILVGTGVQLLLATLVLGLPTFLMGGTLPALARATETPGDAGRRLLALLYSSNTLGAVAGTFLATFLLLEAWGNRTTLWVAGILNLLVALVALGVGQRVTAPSAEPAAVTDPHGQIRPPAAKAGFVFLAAGVVGFCFLLMEMVWYRMLAPLLGGSTYTFGLILAVALVGIGLGSALYSIVIGRRPALLAAFAVTCVLEAGLLILPFALGDRLAVLAALLRPLGQFAFAGHVAAWSALTGLVVLPGALVAGFQFPLLVGLLGEGGRDVGKHTGLAYAWNTLGAILGSLSGGFGLLPLLTAPGAWRLTVALLVILGMAALLAPQSRPNRPWRWGIGAAGLAALAILMMFAPGPSAAWRHGSIGVGRFDVADFNTRNDLRYWINEVRRAAIWEKEGRETSVALLATEGLSFFVNGKSDGNARQDAGTQVMSSVLAALLHPNPQRAFIIGLGTGSTAGWLAQVPSVREVEVVELEPAILEVAERCTPVNAGVMRNPKVKIIVGDGREVLLTSRQRYDLIISEPSNPYRAGVANLFTVDFYREAARKLAPDGFFVQWVQTYEADQATLLCAIASIATVFPEVQVWQTLENDLLFLAPQQPLVYDVARLRQRIQEEPFRSALNHAWRVNDLEGVFARYVANSDFPGTLAADPMVERNTDNRTLLEFMFARTVGRRGDFEFGDLQEMVPDLAHRLPPTAGGDLDLGLVFDRKQSMRLGNANSPRIPEIGTIRINRARMGVHFLQGEFETALGFWQAQQIEPGDLVELEIVAELLANAGEDSARPYVEELRQWQPVQADALLAQWFWRQDEPELATEAFERAFLAYRADPWPTQALMERAIDAAVELATEDNQDLARRLFEALSQPFAVYNAEVSRSLALVEIAHFLEEDPDRRLALRALQRFEPNPVWEGEFLLFRAECYEEVSSPLAPRARRDVEVYQRLEEYR